MFENKTLCKIFGSKRDEIRGKWRRLHTEKLCDQYSAPNIILLIKRRRMRWTEHETRMGDRTGAYRVWMGRPEGKRRTFGRRRHRWKNYIKTDVQEVGWRMDWIDQAQDRDR